MAPILITGGSGQLAQALAALCAVRGLPVRHVGRPECDFAQPATVARVFAEAAPWLVINAAAYTAVDAAEEDPDAAYEANRDGPAQLAALCRAHGTRLIHVSTDYVFDGLQPDPYRETDPTGPTGVYGASKLAGEQAVQATLPEAIVLRTAWVYGARGRNFLLTILNAARAGRKLRVVADQFGCPTLAHDLAEACLAIACMPRWQPGLYHAVGAGGTSWHGFASAILARAAAHGLVAPPVEPITTADWPTRARRPINSRLDSCLLLSTFGFNLPPWTDSMARTVDVVMTRLARLGG